MFKFMENIKILINILSRIADIYYDKGREKSMNKLEDDLSFLVFKYTNYPELNPDKDSD